MKKRIVVAAICLSLLISGCAQVTAVRNFVFGPAKAVLCGFTDAQAHQAGDAAAFVVGTFGYGDASVAIQAAVTTFLNVRAKICVAAEQLEDAIAVFDTAKEEQAKVTYTGPVKAPNIDQLRALVN